MSSSILRHTFCIMCTIVCLSIALIAKISYHSRQELASGDKASSQKNWSQAVVHYERAIKWYVPLSSSVPNAIARLWEIATAAEQRQDLPLALQAYRALRSALYAVESVYIPHQAWIPRCEERIAWLMAQRQQVSDPAQREAEIARFTSMLQRDTSPHLGWSIVMEIGFLGWIGATLLLIWHAYNSQGQLVWHRGSLWGGGIVAGFILWIVGMLFA